MNQTEATALRDLLRRVDEVRGLAGGGERLPRATLDAGDLLDTLDELVGELERSHRRLIETNVQLVSLREVASSMLDTADGEDTTRTVTRYLCRAFGFDEGFLLLIDRESGGLEGTWTQIRDGRERSFQVSIPLLGDHGALSRALWLNRTVVHHTPQRHITLVLPDGHPLHDVLDDLGGCACVPFQRSHAPADGAPTAPCGARCLLGDVSLLAPAPGESAAHWAFEREERQRHCLACDAMPSLGVIGMARRRGSAALSPSDVTQLESIALSVAPVVENARLTQQLRRSERFREHVLDSMASALVAVNMKGEILAFNRVAEQLLGFGQEQVLGQPFGALFGTDGEERIRETLEHGHESARVELDLRARDGGPVPVRFTTSLLRGERRNIYGAIATFVDLTPIRKAEEHARRQDRLAAVGRFTSSVAHEIRNPLAGIGAGVQYLARALATNQEHRENLEFILREIQRLDRIVGDLFDVTHQRRLQRRTAPVEDTARCAVQCVEPLVAERGVRLVVETVPRTPPAAHDPDQMQQVLINLLKNAVEASPPGSTVRVTIAPSSRSPGGARGAAGVTLRVEDQGCGISADDLKTVFEPFFTTKPGGSGLGLYISHDIVKRHGGSLAVSSEPGRGTTFTVELPLENYGGPQ